MSPTSARPAKPRLDWLDFYRGLAVVIMVEAHVVNTFLDPALRTSAWFGGVNYFNGLVAPAFFYIAGYALGLGSRRPGQPGASRRRLRRLAVIALIGYALHFPWAQVQAQDWAEAWRAGTIVDVLPCLAISLAVLTVVARLAGKWTPWVTLALITGVVMAAPQVANFRAAPAPLLAYLNWSTGSLFPLFPWAGFAFAGFFSAGWGRSSRWFGYPCGALVCAGLVGLLGRGDLSAASPAFFFERLIWILLLVSVSQALAACWMPPALRLAGQESLALYVIHLLIISNLQPHLPTLAVGPTAALYVAVLGGSFLLTLGWRRLSVWCADRARRAAHRRESSAPAV